MTFELDNTYTWEVQERASAIGGHTYAPLAEDELALLPVLHDIVAKLATKGAPEQVATHMETLGIKAVCQSSEACAIAEYVVLELRKVNPGLELVHPTVGCSTIEVSHQEEGGRRIASVKTPVVLSNFILAFDAHTFPALVKEDAA